MGGRMGAVAVLALLAATGGAAGVTVGEDGGYDGVVVRVADGVHEEDCIQLIRGLKGLLDLGSSALAGGLQGRAYLASVTLVVPANWRDSMCGLGMAAPAATLAWRRPDLLVGPGESRGPLEVLQGAQCGEPGELIRLPLDRLLGNLTTADGRALARAWARLRYGVFPGQEGEELFPNATSGIGRQAVLCRGRSVREVILAHNDFRSVRVDGEPERNVVPQLVVVREPAAKFVLAIETSGLMAVGESWRWIHKAAHRFLRYQLPVNSALALVTFSGRRVTLEQPLIQVTSQAVRARLADTIPGRYHLATDTEAPCIVCVVEEAVENVLHHDTAGAHLVLITSGRMEAEEQGRLQDMVARGNMQVSTVSLTPEHLRFYDELAASSGGHSFLLQPSVRGLERLHSLNAAFSRVLGSGEEVEVHTKAVYTSAGITEGSFVIDETLGRDTVFGILVEDEEDHLVRSVSFTDGRGTAYGPYTKMSSTFDPVNLKTINYVGRAPPFGDAALRGLPWRYTLEWSEVGDGGRHSLVVITSKPTEGAVLPEVVAWARGLAVYAEVRAGGRPLLGATLSLQGALATGQGGARAVTALPGISMGDMGGEEPDLTAEDGIYSAFLPSGLPAGRLSLAVEVGGEGRREPGPVIQLEDTEAPPGRVRDLRAELEAGQLRVAWSAPGGDYGRGPVAGQRILYSDSIPDLLRGEGSLLYTENSTVEAGAANIHSLELPYRGAPLHLAVVAVDSAGLTGAASNIVTVEAPEEPEMVDAGGQQPTTSGLLLVTERDWILMGVVAGALLVLLLSLTASLAYCYCMARAKPPPRAPSTTSTTHEQISAPSSSSSGSGDEESLHSEMKVVAPQQPLPYHDFAKSLELSQASSPSTSTGTPLYWSASQLLSKLESPPPSLDYRAPPEFSVTVESLGRRGEEGGVCGVREVWHRHRHPPPPLYPKPKNVTQV